MSPRPRCPSCGRLAHPVPTSEEGFDIPLTRIKALEPHMGTIALLCLEWNRIAEEEGEQSDVLDWADALAITVNDALGHSMPAGQPSKKEKAT